MKMKVWPFGAGWQEQASNCLTLLRLRAWWLADEEKARKTRQVTIKKTNKSEPLKTCRKTRRRRQNRRLGAVAERNPGDDLLSAWVASGIEGGMTESCGPTA
jgi:hypothetical protein